MVKTTTALLPSTVAGSSVDHEIKYKGVRKRKWGKYVSEIRLPNCRERIWLGSYDSAEKAARAFDAALFCLRGAGAKFNFPDNPPNIAAAYALTPAEIQTIAQNYANSYGAAGSINPPQDQAAEFASPSADSECTATIESSIDWSFLDILDEGGSRNAGAARVSDFHFFPEPGDEMYMLPPFQDDRGNAEDDDDDGYGYGHDHHGIDGDVTPSLWTF